MKPTKRSHLALSMRAKKDQAGFTLIEILVAFFIVALLATAALPMLVRGLQIASLSSTTSAANQQIQTTLEEARVVPVSCVLLNNKVGVREYSDGRRGKFTVTFSLPAGCTITANGQAIPVRIVAKRTGDGKVLTDLSTKIFVPGTAT